MLTTIAIVNQICQAIAHNEGNYTSRHLETWSAIIFIHMKRPVA